MVWISGGGLLFSDLDRVVDEQRRGLPSSKIEAAHTIVSAVAAVQRANATPEQGAVLDRALAGEWKAGEDDDLEIELAPAESESIDRSARGEAPSDATAP